MIRNQKLDLIELKTIGKTIKGITTQGSIV